MYTGKHANEKRTVRNPKNKKPLLKTLMLMVSMMIIVVGAVGGTVAFLATGTTPVTNTFTYGTPDISIPEKIDNGVKSDVKVQNTSDFDAYVRAMIVVTWKNEAGEVSGTVPVLDTDYTMTMGDAGWINGGDGYYYCKSKVDAGTLSPILIKECKKTATANIPEGYDLSVEVIAELIQAEPDQAVTEAWPVTVSNGTISPKTTK